MAHNAFYRTRAGKYLDGSDAMRLEGKVAIITGAAGSMSAEEARLFAREGAKMVVADVFDHDGMQVWG